MSRVLSSLLVLIAFTGAPLSTRGGDEVANVTTAQAAQERAAKGLVELQKLPAPADMAASAAQEIRKKFDAPKDHVLPSITAEKEKLDGLLVQAKRHLRNLVAAERVAQEQKADLEDMLRELQSQIKPGMQAADPLIIKQKDVIGALTLVTSSALGSKDSLDKAKMLVAAIEAQAKSVGNAKMEIEEALKPKPVEPEKPAPKKEVKNLAEVAGGAEKAPEAQKPMVNQKKPKIFSIIIGMANDRDIGKGVKVSAPQLLGQLRRTLTEMKNDDFDAQTVTIGLPSSTDNLPSRHYPNITNQIVIDRIKEMLTADRGFGPEDTIFCYVMSHGGYSEVSVNENGRLVKLKDMPDFEFGHFLDWKNGERFARVDLFEKLLDQRVVVGTTADRSKGLTVLISEACNTSGGDVGIIKMFDGGAAPDKTSTHLYRLLTEYRGQVSINSCSTDEVGWFRPQTGGFFTNHFLLQLGTHPESDWQTFIRDDVTKAVRAEYKSNPPRPAGISLQAYLLSQRASDSMTPMWMRPAISVGPR